MDGSSQEARLRDLGRLGLAGCPPQSRLRAVTPAASAQDPGRSVGIHRLNQENQVIHGDTLRYSYNDSHSYSKRPFIGSFPIENGDVP